MDNNKKRYIKKFSTILSIALAIYFVLGGVGAWFYLSLSEPAYNPDRQIKDYEASKEKSDEKSKEEMTLTEKLVTAPARTNFLIVGVDGNESLTDTIMVGSFESATNNITLVSIPRDTYVNYKGSHIKINSVNGYAGGGEEGIQSLQEELEELLNISISYYVKVNLEAFRSIVDDIGGVVYTVPEGGLYYTDPAQDLYINLKGGTQRLNGSDAEGLVRFRKGYAQQDLKRMEVQQDFFKEFIKQLLEKETIVANLDDLIIDFIKYVDTNFKVVDIPKYISCIKSIDADKIKTTTLPGYPQMIDGISYYICDKKETSLLSKEYFYGINGYTKLEETTTEETVRQKT